jgi:hypothetical protein
VRETREVRDPERPTTMSAEPLLHETFGSSDSEAESQLPTPASQLPTPPDPTPQHISETFDRPLRERCCQRYHHYINIVFTLVGFCGLIVLAISQAPGLSEKIRDAMVIHALQVLVLFALVYTLYMIIKLMFICFETCILGRGGTSGYIPSWCGCPWIERHQLRYEA